MSFDLATNDRNLSHLNDRSHLVALFVYLKFLVVSYELCPNIAIVFKAMDGYDSLNLDSE